MGREMQVKGETKLTQNLGALEQELERYEKARAVSLEGMFLLLFLFGEF